MTLCGLVPNFCIQVSVNIFPRSVHLFGCIAFAGQSWGYINRSQIHECRNWEQSRPVSFLGIFVLNFWDSAFAVCTNFFIQILMYSEYISKSVNQSDCRFHFSHQQAESTHFPATICRVRGKVTGPDTDVQYSKQISKVTSQGSPIEMSSTFGGILYLLHHQVIQQGEWGQILLFYN